MTFAYDIPNRPTSYPNLREAASTSWRGLTATIQGKPYLVIDKTGDTFILEGENGEVFHGSEFSYDFGSDADRLVAATRIEGSPLKALGTLAYENNEWNVVRSGTDEVLPVEDMVSVLESFNYLTEPYEAHLAGTGLNGFFLDQITGEPVEFHSIDHEPADKSSGVEESWELKGSDGNTYYLVGNQVQDDQGNPAGKFNPYVSQKIADQVSEMYVEEDKKALKCPNCGSHTLRAFDVEKGNAEMKCLTCGNQFKRKVFRNPESKVASVPPAEGLEYYTPDEVAETLSGISQPTYVKLWDLTQHLDETGKGVPMGGDRHDPHGEHGPPMVETPGDRNDFLGEGSTSSIVALWGMLTPQEQQEINAAYEAEHSQRQQIYDEADHMHQGFVESDWSAPSSLSDNHFIETATFTQKEALGYQNPPQPGQLQPAQQQPVNIDQNAQPLAQCPQCGNFTLNTLTGTCSNCGYTNPQLVHPTSPANSQGAYSHTAAIAADGMCPKCDNGNLDVVTHNRTTGDPSKLSCDNCGWKGSWDEAVAHQRDLGGKMFVGKAAAFVDSAGNELRADNWYIMHAREYKVPDVIRVTKIEDGKIEAHFESDTDGKFPLQIEASEGLSFDPYRVKEDPEVIDDKAIETVSGWKISRRNFSPKEQEDLINENIDGRARNYDQLKLDGTHYNTRSNIVDQSNLDNDFLWL